MSEIVIYHNGRCGSSMKTLRLIREAGFEPTVIEYLQTPPTRDTLRELAARMEVPIRALLRTHEALYAEHDLGNPKWSDDELLDEIDCHPVLLVRPIVVTERGAALCRPPDKVLALLPQGSERP